MTVSSINGISFGTLSALDGRTLSTLSAVNGQTIAAGDTLPVTDDFNRGDSAVTLGTASDGIHVWTPQNGTWGISSNRAYSPVIGAGNQSSVATVETGAADCTIQVTLVNQLSVAQATGLIFRLQDITHFYMVEYNWGADQLRLYRFTGGGFFTPDATVALPAPPVHDGGVLKVVLAGTSVEIFYDGVSKISTTETSYQTATAHGLYSGTIGARLDDFSIIA